MVDDASPSRWWDEPPNFVTASRGYWGYEVDRLLEDLQAADQAGEPLAPILDARELSEVGFGYDVAQVDQFLHGLRAADAVAHPSTSPHMPAQKDTAENQAASTAQVHNTTATPEGAVFKRAEREQATPVKPATAAPQQPIMPGERAPSAHMRASAPPGQLPAGPQTYWQAGAEVGPDARLDPREGAAMLAAIQQSGLQPSQSSHESGYDAADVDQFFAAMVNAIRANRPVTAFLRGKSPFKMARRGTREYDIRQVDGLIGRLQRLEASDRAANYPGYAVASRGPTAGVSSRRSLGRILRVVIFLVIAFFVFSNFTDGFFSFGP